MPFDVRTIHQREKKNLFDADDDDEGEELL